MPRGLLVADYDFPLPTDRIAQSPAARRDQSRLMVVDRASGSIAHRAFHDLVELVAPGDALVLNTTKVLRARLLGTRAGGAPGEVLLLHPTGDGRWEAMVRPGGKLRPGRVLHVAPGFDVAIEEIVAERRTRLVRLHCEGLREDDAIERFGRIPLPPYIARADGAADADRYQTVYARETGSVAAPTAGLHFTPHLLERLACKGVHRADVVLHVGAGTFKPVEVEDPAAHVMHEEWYRVTPAAAARVNATRQAGCAVWAVGTTSVRTLETAARGGRGVEPGEGRTDIFIHPPYDFQAVDRIITNFHLPRSTLLMLIAAFAGYELTRHAYEVAVQEGYRFYSYGDAMVIV